MRYDVDEKCIKCRFKRAVAFIMYFVWRFRNTFTCEAHPVVERHSFHCATFQCWISKIKNKNKKKVKVIGELRVRK